MSSKKPLPTWNLFVILSGRGGVGKTLLSMLLTVALMLRERTPRIIEADLQRRLRLLFPERVTTIDIDQVEALENDPLAVARAFAAIPQAAREAALATGVDVILDGVYRKPYPH
jgi:cellulose biosynthesis protein BcsQ